MAPYHTAAELHDLVGFNRSESGSAPGEKLFRASPLFDRVLNPQSTEPTSGVGPQLTSDRYPEARVPPPEMTDWRGGRERSEDEPRNPVVPSPPS